MSIEIRRVKSLSDEEIERLYGSAVRQYAAAIRFVRNGISLPG